MEKPFKQRFLISYKPESYLRALNSHEEAYILTIKVLLFWGRMERIKTVKMYVPDHRYAEFINHWKDLIAENTPF